VQVSTDKPVLVLNAGSSSLRFAVFDAALGLVTAGLASDIGGPDASVSTGGVQRQRTLPDHTAALEDILSVLSRQNLGPDQMAAAGHRVVHGGAGLTTSALVTDAVCEQIRDCVALAPLHNPHNLAAIEALRRLQPDLPQVASFDTAFHATNPEVATRYALPDRPETNGLRRYGFHGLSYSNVVTQFEAVTGQPLPQHVLAAHLGNGASLCAIRDGRSLATTMGYSPLDGLTMGTRCGGIDGNAVLRLAGEMGVEGAGRLLNRDSGLLGLSGGASDMRRLLEDPRPEAAFAVDHFCYWVLRHAGSMIAAMGGCDAVVFTGGIGEHATPIRARIAQGLDWMGAALDAQANDSNATQLHQPSSALGLWIIPAEEERVIASDVLALLDSKAPQAG